MNQPLGLLTGAEDRKAGDAAAHHSNLVATVQTRTVLALLEDLVGQLGLILDGAKAVFEKEIGKASKEANGLDAVLFGLVDERFENASARALALGSRRDHDGAHLAEMRPVKV